MNKSVLFFNWSQENFAHPQLGGNDNHAMWDGQPFAIKSGEKIVLPEYLATHFAKHLADRELYKAGLSTASPDKQVMMQKCFSDSTEYDSKLKLEVGIMNENRKEKELESVESKKSNSSRRSRAKKETQPEIVKEEVFEGLSN